MQGPILARTSTHHGPTAPVAHDFVKLIFVRAGSAFLFSEFGQRSVNPGEAILFAANVLCGAEPEDHVTVTAIYADTDYVVDQVFWQYVGLLQDRLKAQGFAETIYTEPAQILPIGEDKAGMVMPWPVQLLGAESREPARGLAPIGSIRNYANRDDRPGGRSLIRLCRRGQVRRFLPRAQAAQAELCC